MSGRGPPSDRRRRADERLPVAPRARRRAVAERLASLFDEHASMVFGLCRLLLRDHHEAEDAAQQTFVSAYRSLLRGTEPRDAASWLAAIARNECRARIRRRMRAPLALDGEFDEFLADPTDLAEESDRRAELTALTAAIAELPSRQRQAVALREFLGLSYEEVASTLSVSVPVVESLLFRARRRLRDSVRTVPRYAAGIVAIPLAVKAAVSKDVADLDSWGAAGATGLAGAAFAGIVAKVVSLPFATKAATAVTVIAIAAVAPTLGGGSGGDDQPRSSAAPAALGGPAAPGASAAGSKNNSGEGKNATAGSAEGADTTQTVTAVSDAPGTTGEAVPGDDASGAREDKNGKKQRDRENDDPDDESVEPDLTRDIVTTETPPEPTPTPAPEQQLPVIGAEAPVIGADGIPVIGADSAEAPPTEAPPAEAPSAEASTPASDAQPVIGDAAPPPTGTETPQP
jgi:RNA polymerase sigma factor (sigma-70 family)